MAQADRHSTTPNTAPAATGVTMGQLAAAVAMWADRGHQDAEVGAVNLRLFRAAVTPPRRPVRALRGGVFYKSANLAFFQTP
jgi:hypothetical protein